MTDDGNGNGALARHFYLFRVASDTQCRVTVSTAFGILASNHIRMQYMYFLVVLVTRQKTRIINTNVVSKIKSNQFSLERSRCGPGPEPDRSHICTSGASGRQAASGLARLQFFWPATRARGGGNGQWLLELYKLRTPPQISLIIASINYCTNALQYSIIYGLARVDFKIVL
jgi:hypothetical protein